MTIRHDIKGSLLYIQFNPSITQDPIDTISANTKPEPEVVIVEHDQQGWFEVEVEG